MNKLGAILLTSFILAACGQTDERRGDAPAPTPDDKAIELIWDKEPVANTENNAAILKVALGGEVVVENVDPQMPAHGHGTVTSYQKVKQVTCEDSPKATCFELTGFFFVMPGDWVVNITIAVDGKKETHTFPVEVK